MKLKDVKDRLTHAAETENPPGTNYYGTETDEGEVEAARERMDKATRRQEDAAGDSESHTSPIARRQGP
jgi:hypothetical protein